MHKFFVHIYVFVLIIWTVEKSDCKQGGNCVYLLIIKLIIFFHIKRSENSSFNLKEYNNNYDIRIHFF